MSALKSLECWSDNIWYVEDDIVCTATDIIDKWAKK